MPEGAVFTRKKPTQRRAAATVATLVEAGFQVLERDGAERLSTTAVAERAGVSIGTLYQYFCNKDELLKAMARQEVSELLQSVFRAFAASPGGYRARSVVRTILRTFWDAPANRQAAFPLLLRYVARADLMREVKAFTAGLGRDLALRQSLSDEAAFVLTRAVLGVVSAAVSEPHNLDRERLEDELVQLILRYLNLVGAEPPERTADRQG
ncbi:MAG: TetR/AcrR family transcriptional regulator [Phenylobacterium sp.]|nr:TetR/AcrR family transcriptional regulator [Phenylobacterium sp.]MDZ4322045.1 TetR/AcrR family transcriptional regulator [Phenylobacterium sp.]